MDDSAGLSGRSLGSERSVSRSRDPSLHSRGNSSVRADTSVYIPAHQRDRRIGESNSDSRRKEFYEQRREAVSSRDHGRDYAKDREHGRDYTKDRDRNKDYAKDKDRDGYKGAGRDQRGPYTGSSKPLQGQGGRPQEALGRLKGQERGTRPSR